MTLKRKIILHPSVLTLIPTIILLEIVNQVKKYVKIDSFNDKMDSLEFSSESNDLKEFNYEDFEH